MTPRRTPLRAQHGVELVPLLGRLEQRLLLGVEPDGRLLDGELAGVGEEFVQRRVEQAHRHRQPVHRLEDLDEVGALGDAQLLEGGVLGRGVLGEDHPAHDGQAVLGDEHVLGPAQADALGPHAPAVGGVGAVVGVGPHLEVALADDVGPAEERLELRGRLGFGQLHLAEDDLAGGAVDARSSRPSFTTVAPTVKDRARDADLLGPHHGRLAPARGPPPRRARRGRPGR